MKTIALAIIAKDEVEQVKNICEKYSQHFDNIYVLCDYNYDDFKNIQCDNLFVAKYKRSDEEKDFGGIFFDRKRTTLAKFIKEDYYFRLDTDDEIINPEIIRDFVQNMDIRGSNIAYTLYDYSKDEFGNSIAVHYRETIIKNDDAVFWNKPIHENLLPTNEKKFKAEKTQLIQIKHNIDVEHSLNSLKRNLKYLIWEYNKDKENCDPRTIVYIARSLFGLGEFDRAIPFFERHIKLSGWSDDRFFSWCALSELYRLKGDFETAISAGLEAITEKPTFPDGYLKMGDVYFEKGDWNKSIEWTLMGLGKKIPETMMVVNPTDYTWKPMLTLAMSYMQTSKFEEAYRYFEAVKRIMPDMDFVKQNESLFLEGLNRSKFTEHFAWVAKYFESMDKESIKRLIESIPKQLDDHELVIGLKQMYMPPKTWDKDTITILCSPASEPWSPKSIATGIGGSEEATIRLAEQFQKIGYRVTVYCDCDKDEGVYDGVKYIDFQKFNRSDRFNIFISWRRNHSYLIDARYKIFWIHDLPRKEDLDEEIMRMTDLVVVLSEYHKSLLPETVPAEKVFVSTNGLVPEDFDVISGIPRQKNRIIYASSYDRGLETILNGWGEIKKEIPDAELHIFYGWNTYDVYLKEGVIADGGKWKNHMCELMKQDGVYEHGRVGHKELLVEYAKSDILAYPCTYSGEINCIALSKAIACGCYPVTNDFAVLPERNTVGVSVEDEKFVNTVINSLKENDSRNSWDTSGYIEKMSWNRVARDWKDRIDREYIETKFGHRAGFIWENLEENKSIVDIGCNDGHLFKGTELFDNVTFVDLDDFGLPRYIKADAQELPIDDKKFDIAVVAEILEHVPDPVKAIKEAMRVSNKVIITVPNEHEWPDCYKPFYSIERLEKETGKTREEIANETSISKCKEFYDKDNFEHLWHIRYYTPQTLEEDLKKAGATKYKIFKIRDMHWSHIGAVIYE